MQTPDPKDSDFFTLGIAQRAILETMNTPFPSLDHLNPEQRKAVETTEGPLLILAGAGTGKTRVLTTRIGYILNTQKASFDEILAVTFTNKAAEEMKRRISSITGLSTQKMPWVGTFHAISLKILRAHASVKGLTSDCVVLDTDDQIRLIKQILEKNGINEKQWSARLLGKMIDHWKNRGLSPKNIEEKDSRAFAEGKGRKMYEIYQEHLQKMNACDYGDLLMHTLDILRLRDDILAQYQKKFKYVMVDEYQDTNTTQYMFLRLLMQQKNTTQQNVNICCVGDDDQSIYSWRGAEVSNILRFEKDFPSASIIRLERNYRSTSHILAVAAHLIAHNKKRIGKTLHSDQSSLDDQPVSIHAAHDSEEEAYQITHHIRMSHQKGKNFNETAVLVRASFQMRTFEERFVTEGINYRVIGGPKFYERLEIKEALSFFRVVASPMHNLSFERIINVPKRGLGKESLECIRSYADKNSLSLFAAAQTLATSESSNLGKKAQKSLYEIIKKFEHWQNNIPLCAHTELATMIVEESGYMDMLRTDPSLKAQERIENIKELIRSLESYESLHTFLDHVALVMDTEEKNPRDAVSLMTMHAAKGLEFETVFLPGWEEEVFPHPRCLNEHGDKGLEEERRLAYVAITRAKKNLHIWFTSRRKMHGFWQCATPSRFLEELPEKNIAIGHRQTPNKTILPLAEMVEKNDLSIGNRVFHIKFGAGSIQAIDGEKCTILFEKAGEKKILKKFVEKI